MLLNNGSGLLVLGFILAVACASAYAQQKVYKWVDENGVVHFSEESPPDTLEVDVDTIVTDPPPSYVPPARTTIKSRPASETVVEKQPAQPQARVPSPAPELDVTQMSLEDLDRRCEDAREEKIAPLRDAEIANCIETETGDLAWCEAFWADYGDATRTASGYLTPRMFHDLPECTEAWEERIRR